MGDGHPESPQRLRSILAALEAITISLLGQPDRIYYRAAVAANDGFLGELPADLMAEPNIPPGHPEGFHDAFARLHRCFEADVRKWQATGKANIEGDCNGR